MTGSIPPGTSVNARPRATPLDGPSDFMRRGPGRGTPANGSIGPRGSVRGGRPLKLCALDPEVRRPTTHLRPGASCELAYSVQAHWAEWAR